MMLLGFFSGVCYGLVKRGRIGPWVRDIVFPCFQDQLADRSTAAEREETAACDFGIAPVRQALDQSVGAVKI